MNITKTNMLSLDNKIKKDGAVNTVVSSTATSKAKSNAGINALMFQGMQNLMANPMLAKKTGVMNDEPKADTETAKSFVAPYSSNIAFQGAASKTMKTAAIGALMAIAASLASCQKETITQTQIVDLAPVVNAINALRQDMSDYNNAETQRDKETQQAIQEAINGLFLIQASIQAQTFSIDYFREIVEGHMENGEFQRSAILNAIIKLQGINEASARAIVNAILTAYEKGQITFDQAMSQILAQLQNTNDKIDDANQNLNDIKEQLVQLNKQFAEFSAKYDVDMAGFKSAFGDISKLLGKVYVDGKNRTALMADLNMKMSALLADVEKMKKTAVDIKNNIKQGVSIDYNQLEEMFKILNMHQQASKDEIVAKLDEFIAGQENLEAAIKKLDQNNGNRTRYIAYLIKNKTNDNADVIEAINNLAASNEANITAAAEALAEKLDALNAKADAGLIKMDDIAGLLKQYGDKIYNKLDVDNQKILDAIKANGKKLDIANMSLEELKAEVEKIKPELVKLNGNAEEANEYLDIISKRQLEIKQEIENLENIAGGGLTKDELEELWKAHDANAFAKAKAYLDGIHAEDMDKADEIIEYLKKGNKTAGDTYELLLDFANKANLKADDLKKLLQAVYDYLPELICKCNCGSDTDHNQQTHEGIIGILS